MAAISISLLRPAKNTMQSLSRYMVLRSQTTPETESMWKARRSICFGWSARSKRVPKLPGVKRVGRSSSLSATGSENWISRNTVTSPNNLIHQHTGRRPIHASYSHHSRILLLCRTDDSSEDRRQGARRSAANRSLRERLHRRHPANLHERSQRYAALLPLDGRDERAGHDPPGRVRAAGQHAYQGCQHRRHRRGCAGPSPVLARRLWLHAALEL